MAFTEKLAKAQQYDMNEKAATMQNAQVAREVQEAMAMRQAQAQQNAMQQHGLAAHQAGMEHGYNTAIAKALGQAPVNTIGNAPTAQDMPGFATQQEQAYVPQSLRSNLEQRGLASDYMKGRF